MLTELFPARFGVYSIYCPYCQKYFEASIESDDARFSCLKCKKEFAFLLGRVAKVKRELTSYGQRIYLTLLTHNDENPRIFLDLHLVSKKDLKLKEGHVISISSELGYLHEDKSTTLEKMSLIANYSMGRKTKLKHLHSTRQE